MLFCKKVAAAFTVSFGFVLLGSSPWSFFKSFVRMSLEKSVIPELPGVGSENFMLQQFGYSSIDAKIEKKKSE